MTPAITKLISNAQQVLYQLDTIDPEFINPAANFSRQILITKINLFYDIASVERPEGFKNFDLQITSQQLNAEETNNDN